MVYPSYITRPMSEKELIDAYDMYADAIFRHCFFRVFNREKAKDMAQDVFVKTWGYISRGGEIKNIRAFLYKVATNLIIDESRKKRALSLDALMEEGFDFGADGREKAENIISAKEALTLVEKLDDNHREIVLMRYVEGLSPKEIAEILGETENMVSVRIHRGVKKIKELVKNV